MTADGLMSAQPPTTAEKRTSLDFRVGPGHEVAALQPAARGASGEAGANLRSQ